MLGSPTIDPSPSLPLPPASTLAVPLARLMRPLLRLLIRSGLTWPVFAELVRGLYVEQASRMLEEGARTDSRLSLLTGVHRKELRRLREAGIEEAELPPVVSLTSQIIARWLGLPAYTDAQARPLPLPRPAFERLVTSVTTDLRPRTVLDEWLAQGIATIDAQERVLLTAEAYLPRPGSEAQLYYFGRNLHDHMAAAAANLAGDTPPRLERAVHYDRLPLAVAERLEAEARAAAQRMLVEVNRTALALLEAHGEARAGEPTRRVNLGVYLHAEDEAPKGGKG